MRELANAAGKLCCWRAAAGETVNPQLLLQEPTPLDRRALKYERQVIPALNIHQGRINEVAGVPANST